MWYSKIILCLFLAPLVSNAKLSYKSIDKKVKTTANQLLKSKDKSTSTKIIKSFTKYIHAQKPVTDMEYFQISQMKYHLGLLNALEFNKTSCSQTKSDFIAFYSDKRKNKRNKAYFWTSELLKKACSSKFIK